MADKSESKRPNKFHRETPFLPDSNEQAESPDGKIIEDTLSQCIQALIAKVDFSESISAALELMACRAKFYSVKFFRVTENKGGSIILQRLFTWSSSDGFSDNMFRNTNGSTGRSIPDSWRLPLLAGKPIVIEKESDIQIRGPNDSMSRQDSITAVPVLIEKHPVAVSLFSSTGSEGIHTAWFPTTQELCVQINALCLRRIKTHDSDQRRTREFELIRRAIYRSLEESVRHRNDLRKAYRQLEGQNVQLMDAKKIAEESGRLKSEFLAMSSHELRTPLNTMIGFLSMYLLKNLSEEERRELVQTAHDSASKLLKIINDILEIAKVESGRFSAFPMEIPVEEFFGELSKSVPTQFKKEGLKIEIVGPKHGRFSVWADLPKLRRLMMILIDNACKFTEAGTVEVGVRESNDDMVEFFVRDTGIGIPEIMLEYVFDPFTQVDGKLSRRYGGVGLGLSLAKKLALILNGDISIESDGVGQGTTARVKIPHMAKAREEAPALSSELPRTSYERDLTIKVLVTGLPLRFLHRIEERIEGSYQFVHEPEKIASSTLVEKDRNWDVFIVGLAELDGDIVQCLSKATAREGLHTIVISSLAKEQLKDCSELESDSIASVFSWDQVMKDSAPVMRTLETIRAKIFN